MELCTNSMAPTSTPRVGWETISSLGFDANSRAMMTFCILPPDSVEIVVSGAAPRTSNLAMRLRAKERMLLMDNQPNFAIGGVRWVAAMLSATLRPGPAPSSRSEEHTSELQSPLNLVCR